MKKSSTLILPQQWLLLLLLVVGSFRAVAQPTGCTGNDPGGNPATNGLYAEYYAGYFADDHAFFTSGPAPLQRVDAQVNFAADSSWGNIAPPASGSLTDPELYSTRFRGSIRIPVSGSYTFYLTSDDASYLWLDSAAQDLPALTSRAAINNGGAHGAITQQVTLTLTAGYHNVLIHYGEYLYGNTLVWEWASADAGIVRAPVPSSVLCTRVQNARQLPLAITYSPNTATASNGTAVSSGVPTVNDGGLPITAFAIANAAALPAGISINASTGVLTAAATVPTGQYSVNVSLTNADGVSTFSGVFSFTILPPPPSGCAGTDPGGAAPSAGLYMEFYAGYFMNDPAFFTTNTPSLRRIDAQLAFGNGSSGSGSSWGNILPPASGSSNNPEDFSVRVRGSIRVTTPGFYTLYLTSDDGSYLWLDNAAIAVPVLNSQASIDNGGMHGEETDSTTVYLTVGLHNVLIHYGESEGGNVLRLEWKNTDAGIARQVIPQSVLCSVVQPERFPPLALSYSPATRTVVSGTTQSSVAPVVDANGHGPITGFVLANAAALPAGITLNAATGVLTAGTSMTTGTYAVDVVAINAEGATLFRNSYTFVITPPPPAACIGTGPGGQGASAGLWGEYYAGYFDDLPNNQAFFNTNTPVIARTEPSINFTTPETWGNLVPPGQGTEENPDFFSLRLRGSFYVATAGMYTFYLTSDDASYLWLDNAALAATPATSAALINNGQGHPPIMVKDSVMLAVGLHNLLIHYGEYVGGNTLVLEWSSRANSIARQLVPTTSFCSVVQPVRPLPVSLVRFGAKASGPGVEVTWQTAQEIENDYFEVERSADGRSFEAVGRVAGAGSTSSLRNYRLVDTTPLAGLSYYRLKQVDFDATTTYNEPAVVRLTGGTDRGPAASVYPNPSHGAFVLRMTEPAALDTQLQVLDMRGRCIYTETLPAGTKERAIRTTSWQRGVYALRLTNAKGSSTVRLVVD
ncbi:T9SS type A sorting domain-containing protein [Hymenobacter busanensis]|uniref:T9SS type A sorting domain-containing protein n=1 Tax=Hymenobacter busanensis TaxID=2607656 RepID=A0A7L4ZYL0_9BACT|nr:PA14 domain-containing protein [Hymenobacter busanensis]KAA9331410.1 T9SS type A sorting domain-containing protein [Hymenobacter busanensis]QHJ08564.1 T9SS type A sorting domain-containing protein [Hymenobacter busanensis]